MTKSIILFTVAAFFLSSCEPVQQFTQTPSAVVAPKFTTIDKLIQLTPGMSFSEVVTTLSNLKNQTIFILLVKESI